MVVVMVVVKLLLLFVPYPSWHQLLEVNQDNPFGSFFAPETHRQSSVEVKLGSSGREGSFSFSFLKIYSSIGN